MAGQFETFAPSLAVVALLVALIGLALAGAMAAGAEAGRRISRAAAQEYALAHPRARAVALIGLDPWPATRAANVAHAIGITACTILATVALTTWLDSAWIVLVVALLVAGLLVVFVGELIPRRIGRRHAASTLALVGPLMLGAATVAQPFLARRRMRDALDPTRYEGQPDAQNLRDMVDRVGESEQIDQEERDMLQSVFELGTTRVREVMVPRPDMVSIGRGETVTRTLNLFVRSGFSRVPVIGDSVDELLGILYLKDVLAYTVRKPDFSGDTVDELVRPALFVPETKVVDDLLDEMRREMVHIAIVVDEYGGVAGLVTIEDILEELVGELTDEHDRGEEDIVPDGDSCFIIPARLGLDELGELFGIDISDDEVTTAAGLLTKALGRVPIRGSQAHSHGLNLQALDIQGRRKRLHTLRVWRDDELSGDSPEDSAETEEGNDR